MNWQNKKILVLGLGKTGLSMMHFWQNQSGELAGYDHTLPDEKRIALAQAFPESSFFSGSLKEVLRNNQFDILGLSPGISAYAPEIADFRAKGGKVLGDVAVLCSLIHGRRDKIIAITGSNGKSTVTELVGFLCEKSGLDTVVAGNIGLPVLDAYQAREGKSADVWVLELSSFQLETVENLSADAATCLNVSEDHLDRYESLLDYAHAKERIFQAALCQVLNADDVLCCAMHHKHQKTQYFSITQKSDYGVSEDGQFLHYQGQKLCAIQNLALQGQHNIANILAALALCEGIGLLPFNLAQWLPEFGGLPHRVQKIGEMGGVVFIDDSKGTNVGATCAALSGAGAPVLLIVGGLGKGQDFSPLARAVQQYAKAVFLIGEDASTIQAALKACDIPMSHHESLQAATKAAFQAASSGDWVMLSPACASMDMFRDYIHRAEVFIESFKGLNNG